MKIQELIETATNKGNFPNIQSYINFSLRFLEHIENSNNRQAIIISLNENNYRFYQFNKESGFAISRPFNFELLYGIVDAPLAYEQFLYDINSLLNYKDKAQIENPSVISRSIYTIQQSIGFALDAGIGSGLQSNTARKINGDLFEQLIILLMQEIGINCLSGTVNIPVMLNGEKACSHQFQHDMIIKNDNEDIKALGSVKTTSKDRITKIFADKFFYSRLTETEIPHIAIFLHDVQRANAQQGEVNQYNVNATFLPGHFKAYTIKLNALDGVYYCDLRPNMKNDTLLKKYIYPLEILLTRDVWKFLQ